jgi:hypothetical protein
MDYALALQHPGTDWTKLIIESIRSWWNKMVCPEEENYFLIN